MTATHDSILKVDRRGRICDSAEQRSALCHEWWRGSGGCNPVGGGESDSLAGQHGGHASQKVFEIVTRINPETAAVLNEGLDDGRFLVGILAVEELGDASLVTTFAPMIDDASAGNIGDPEVASFGFAVTGFETVDGGFIELPRW